MATTITTGADTITPTFIDGLSTTREPGNLMHPVLGSAVVDVTYRPAKHKSGTLTLGFATEAAAILAEGYHATRTLFTIASTDRNQIVFKYVVAGSVTLRLDDATRGVWILEVPFQEVLS
jgi:hypothetical protein